MTLLSQTLCVLKVLVPQSCLTLCNPMDWSIRGSSIHGILQARILQWVAIRFPRGYSRPRDQTQVSCIAGTKGGKIEAVTDFLFLGSKSTVDGDCSQEIRKCLPLAWKAMTNRQCVEEQKHYSADKGLYSQSYGLPTGHISL